MGKDIPTSRLGRLSRLAGLGARASAGRVLAAFGSKTAQPELAKAAADALGDLRGLALKMGQMASYVDGFVPDEHKDAYERTLKTLRAAAPTMSPEGARRVVRSELGASPEELFVAWEEEPFASASIGQVHRARLEGAGDVAVKVQYEGVDRAVEADLRNAGMLTTLAGPFGAKFGAREQFAEMRARFTEELDYAHEAERQTAFADIFAGDASIRIPRVVLERSSRRVLTSTFAGGIDFDAACARPEEERRAYAETLWRFVFSSLLEHALFNADPHPGNYVFGEAGTVWFLDFGCSRRVPEMRMPCLRNAHRAAANGRTDEFVEQALAMFDIEGRPRHREMASAYLVQCFEPILAGRPYRMTRAFCRGLYDGIRRNAEVMAFAKKSDFAPLPAEWMFFNRLQLGFYSVLARLDVEVDYAALQRELLARVPA